MEVEGEESIGFFYRLNLVMKRLGRFCREAGGAWVGGLGLEVGKVRDIMLVGVEIG